MRPIHVVYDELNDIERQDVDRAFDAVAQSLKRAGQHVSWDDRAERLVEAIAVFLKDSRPK